MMNVFDENKNEKVFVEIKMNFLVMKVLRKTKNEKFSVKQILRKRKKVFSKCVIFLYKNKFKIF